MGSAEDRVEIEEIGFAEERAAPDARGLIED